MAVEWELERKVAALEAKASELKSWVRDAKNRRAHLELRLQERTDENGPVRANDYAIIEDTLVSLRNQEECYEHEAAEVERQLEAAKEEFAALLTA